MPTHEMPIREVTDDQVWRALADPTRRHLLDRLREAPRTTGDLVACCGALSRCAVMKHLGVLERAGLVIARREGRFRWNHLNPAPLQTIYERWLSPHVAPLAAAAVRLKAHAERVADDDEAPTDH